MIVKRKRRSASHLSRTIVRRTRATVGEHKRTIVRRVRGGDGSPPGSGGRQWHWHWHFGRRWRFGAAGLVVVLAVAGAGAWAWQSTFFQVNQVQVEGAGRISPETVIARSGLLGQRMFSADLASAQEQLYSIPLLHSVSVRREWPDTIRIVVVERQPWGTWDQGGVRYTIDREGVVLGTIPPAAGSPVIKSAETTSLHQGDRVSYQAVDAAAEIYEKLPRQLGTTVTEVAYVPGKGVQVTTADGQVALLGDSSSIAYKLAVWAALARQAQDRHINYTQIDLRFGNRPVLQ